MKKVLAFLAALTLAVSVTACGDKIRQENQSSDNSADSSDVSPDQTGSQNPDNSDNESSEPEPLAWHQSDEDGFKEMIDIFEMDDIAAPGERLKKADADFLYGSKDRVVCAGYDFSYLRKVKPVFRNSIDEPGMINWETLEIVNEPEMTRIPDSDYFKIKAGDVLENGLTVKTAKTAFGFAGDGLLNELDIRFDGELTLEGVLECVPEDEYVIGKGELLFYPDSVKHTGLVTPYEEYADYPWSHADPENKFAMIYDGMYYSFGNVNDAPSGISDLFSDDVYIKAKVTFSDIQFKQRPGGVRGFATVKSVEKLG